MIFYFKTISFIHYGHIYISYSEYKINENGIYVIQKIIFLDYYGDNADFY